MNSVNDVISYLTNVQPAFNSLGMKTEIKSVTSSKTSNKVVLTSAVLNILCGNRLVSVKADISSDNSCKLRTTVSFLIFNSQGKTIKSKYKGEYNKTSVRLNELTKEMLDSYLSIVSNNKEIWM